MASLKAKILLKKLAKKHKQQKEYFSKEEIAKKINAHVQSPLAIAYNSTMVLNMNTNSINKIAWSITGLFFLAIIYPLWSGRGIIPKRDFSSERSPTVKHD